MSLKIPDRVSLSWFRQQLLKWNKISNSRQMPWKGEKDFYRVWLSEVILQQTRVEQGLAYYQRFLEKFPTIAVLAEASQEDVFKSWQGLGYYSRCRNLIESARYIHVDLKGECPQTFEEILKLKGVGNYTAAAIASFVYDLPHAVVDGNVFRVLSRFFGIDVPVDATPGRAFFTRLAALALDKKKPGIYNQAIMDFGATVCKPLSPACESCSLQMKCVAFNKRIVKSLPVKLKQVKRRSRFFNYLALEYKGKYYMKKRTKKDIWQNLYEYPMIETEGLVDFDFLAESSQFGEWVKGKFNLVNTSREFVQQLTHQTIHAVFYHIRIYKPVRSEVDGELYSESALQTLPHPKIVASYLED